jgi:hypothetical protein
MGTQKAGYYTKDGTRVPSVTTVLGRYKESGALIHWAAGQSVEYVKREMVALPDPVAKIEIIKLCELAKHAYRDVRDAAADAGTLAHNAVEQWIKGSPVSFGDSDVERKAKKSFDAFMEWADQTSLKVTHTEVPLVSEKYKFGGTLDAMLIRSRRSLGDWKCANAIYGEYLCQIAAYGLLWNENFPNDPVDGGYHLLRFDKIHGDYHHHFWSELDTARNSFLLMRELYANEAELKARSK